MSQDKATAPDFLSFCTRVKKELGEASDEILFAWYYDTFQKATNKPAGNGKQPANNEKK